MTNTATGSSDAGSGEAELLPNDVHQPGKTLKSSRAQNTKAPGTTPSTLRANSHPERSDPDVHIYTDSREKEPEGHEPQTAVSSQRMAVSMAFEEKSHSIKK